MTASKGKNQPKAEWTEDRLDTLRRFYADFKTEDVACILGLRTGQVYAKANQLGLAKSEAFLASPAACRLRRGDNVGSEHRFQKGHASWNKGTKGIAGVQEACRATQFKPGQAPPNTLPVGSTKFDKSGVLLQKVSNAPGNGSKRWRAVHELVWIRTNGPVPPKHIVVFKPGMRTNVLEEITIDRVECISLAENMKRNTRHNLPPELNEIVQLKAVLTRQINKRMKHGQEEHR
jgi:hypothetical protein